jgi:hypothetical protein
MVALIIRITQKWASSICPLPAGVIPLSSSLRDTDLTFQGSSTIQIADDLHFGPHRPLKRQPG